MSDLVVSSNEIDALVKKAAKGAGMAWGLAADAGKAARWLADHGLPGPEVIADLLDWRDGRDHAAVAPPDVSLSWADHGAVLDPIVVGTVCADLAERLAAGPTELGTVQRPVLLGFALAVAARRTGTPLVAGWAGAELAVDAEGATVAGADDALLDSAVAVSVRPGTGRGRRLIGPDRGWSVDGEAWARLERYAHRTYAPDTEQSRLTGAGAGLIDD